MLGVQKYYTSHLILEGSFSAVSKSTLFCSQLAELQMTMLLHRTGIGGKPESSVRLTSSRAFLQAVRTSGCATALHSAPHSNFGASVLDCIDQVNGEAHADDGDKDVDARSRSKPQPKAKAGARKTRCLKKGPAAKKQASSKGS